LTPKGIKEKINLTNKFLKRKMEEYDRLREEIEKLKIEATGQEEILKEMEFK
jgi:hypothetical protein